MAPRELAQSAIHLLLAISLAVTAAAMPAHTIAGQSHAGGMVDDMAGMPCGEMGGMGEGTTDADAMPDDMRGGDCDLKHCDWTACLGIACLPALQVARVVMAEPELPRWTPVLRLSRTLDKLLRPPIA